MPVRVHLRCMPRPLHRLPRIGAGLRLRIGGALALVLLACPPLAAATSSGTAGTGAAPAAQATGGDDGAERALLARALQLAERGPLSAARSAAEALSTHVLSPYLEMALLRRAEAPDPAAIERFLAVHRGQPVADLLREHWADSLARRGDWKRFVALLEGRPADALPPQRRCQLLVARLAITPGDASVLDRVEKTWLSGTSLPDACDPAFAALQRAGRITPAVRTARIVLAAEAGQPGLMRHLAGGLPAAEAARARAWADFIEAPTAAAAAWTADADVARVVTAGLQRLARDQPDEAERLLQALAQPLVLAPAQRLAVQRSVALWSAVSYLPRAAARLAALPAHAYDAQLHEWRVREAIARGDDAAALAAIVAMPAGQRGDSRWRYLEARLKGRTGDAAGATTLLQSLAREPNWFGFLAADRSGEPYALCPVELDAAPAVEQRVAQDPALQRALLLFALDRRGWATREWAHALAGFDDGARRLAVARAVDAGWYDRAVFGLGEGDQALYTLRFPLDHAPHLRDAARRQSLDPAWVAALIRAESVWMADARSGANARGLMQLLPATGRQLARELGLAWSGAATLYQPLTNITLGTRYLRAMLDRFDGKPVAATAAYNAGPTPATRWLAQRPLVEPDLWIETIPYRETREYVARVFAFSVIYDWRLGGSATPLSARLEGRTVAEAARKPFACPASPALAGGPASARSGAPDSPPLPDS